MTRAISAEVVAKMIALGERGMSRTEIAIDLGLSLYTVGKYVGHIVLTRFTTRPLIFFNDVIFVPLTKGLVAQIDFADIDVLGDKNWCATTHKSSITAYAHSTRNGRTVSLHREIMQAPAGVEVDHKDSNGLNCRRSNLRLCTSQQNKRNLPPKRGSRSGQKGVSWDNRAGKWKSEICISGRRKYLGLFASASAAHAAYKEAALKEFGEFARFS